MSHLFKTLITLLLFSSVYAEMVFLVERSESKVVGRSYSKGHYDEMTTDGTWSLYPDVSSGGRYLTYVKGEDENSLNVVVEDRVEDIKEVWGTEGFHIHPRFSPKGEFLFFSSKIEGENKIVKLNLKNLRSTLNYQTSGDYRIYNVDFKSLITENTQQFFPTVFADGERIVYQRNQSGKRSIVLKKLISGSETVIDEGMSPALSKDEKFIAYTKKVNGNWDIYVYNRFTEKTLKVTSNTSFDFSPAFDEKNNLFYTSDRVENGIFSIYKQSQPSWEKGEEKEEIYLTKASVSFYAPKLSGVQKYKMEKLPELSGTPRSSFGTVAHQGVVYVVGGHQGKEHTYPPESFTNRMTGFDIDKKQWKDLAPRLHKAHGFSIVGHGNYLYAFGGFAYEGSNYPKWKSLNVIERYNITENKWEIVGQMPRNRSSNVAVKLGDKVFLIGGWDSTPKFSGDLDGTFHDEIDVFDLKTETISTLEKKLPIKRRAFSAFARGENIFLLGGISEGADHFALLDLFTKFNTEKKSFSELKKLPFATFAPASETLKDEAFVFGGMYKVSKWNYEYIPHIYRYSFEKNEWSHTGRYLMESKGFSSVVKYDGRLGVLGGHSYQNNSDAPVSSFETFRY